MSGSTVSDIGDAINLHNQNGMVQNDHQHFDGAMEDIPLGKTSPRISIVSPPSSPQRSPPRRSLSKPTKPSVHHEIPSPHTSPIQDYNARSASNQISTSFEPHVVSSPASSNITIPMKKEKQTNAFGQAVDTAGNVIIGKRGVHFTESEGNDNKVFEARGPDAEKELNTSSVW
eukprot:CAMPEP_0113321042 /NCGR_PEP_ID=MMETSP0010_2-20120614/14658_1 /TAXON_ID=216773 ORGANISM="Corethron hystrix, Strain 308" /NCGR_SAMPLE_ID=MMETSP0010_2 /ASSEMBLY_ACC=CAM_ASM_000155 /LENGTH=172 /DNA_ID=CAMNT_0000179043 /DNA_START=141 /DNA_END=656 /DNA_ORIENTATION=- /assembly_acc=CAM_ASM_000155